jgi:hypothetical protein
MPAGFPNDDTGDALRRLEQDGDRFEIPRDVDFSVVFPDESAARAFAEHFERMGHRVDVRRSEVRAERPWDVTVVKNMALFHAAITEFEDALQQVAADLLGGANDGGCFSQNEKFFA